jgi:hypothetical protein
MCMTTDRKMCMTCPHRPGAKITLDKVIKEHMATGVIENPIHICHSHDDAEDDAGIWGDVNSTNVCIGALIKFPEFNKTETIEHKEIELFSLA